MGAGDISYGFMNETHPKYPLQFFYPRGVSVPCVPEGVLQYQLHFFFSSICKAFRSFEGNGGSFGLFFFFNFFFIRFFLSFCEGSFFFFLFSSFFSFSVFPFFLLCMQHQTVFLSKRKGGILFCFNYT